jgi:lysosomal-associated membrane protein 1/2
MNNKLFSIVLILASMVLISSGTKLGLPVNYTWPLKTKNLCFAAQFDLTLNVEYLKTDGTNGSIGIPLNDDTFESFNVACSAPDNVHQLTISMLNAFTSIIFNFTVDETNTTSLKKISGYLFVDNTQTYIKDYSNITAGLHKFSSKEEALFETGRNKSYRCNTKTSIKNFQTNGTLSITGIDITNLKIQPFVDDSQPFKDYDAEDVCKADVDKNSNLIPIIVGACLGLLVVIVLVAYLIGRRRSHNGYHSV